MIQNKSVVYISKHYQDKEIEIGKMIQKHLQNEEKVNSHFLIIMTRFVINFEE